MAKDLRPLGDWVSKTTWPNTPCPACGDGVLAVDSLVTVEAAESARWHGHENWDPDMIRGAFHGALRCGLTSCGEPVVVSGDFIVGPDVAVDGSWFGEYDEFFRLRYAQPALPIVQCPDATPDTVRDAAAAAARVVWTDPGSAANRLRFATEGLLTAQKIRRFEVVGGKRRRISAHRRIEEFRKRNAPAGDALMAVKWIGNEGSHADALTSQDVLAGADVLGHALRLLYDTSAEELKQLIRRTNKAKGLPKTGKRGAP